MRFSLKYILLFVFGLSSILVYWNQKTITISLTTFFNQISNIDYSSTFDSDLPHDSDYIFGIDISKYQGKIKWNIINESHHPIKYVIIRSTMGDDRKDVRYKDGSMLWGDGYINRRGGEKKIILDAQIEERFSLYKYAIN